MKFSFYYFFIVLVFCLTLTSSNAMKMKLVRLTPKEGCVIIYKDCNYEGQSVEICDNQSDFRIFDFRDQASSISLGKNVKAQLFQEKDYGGENYLVTEDQSCFVFKSGLMKFNDRVNSLKIVKIPPKRPAQGCVRIFEKCNYEGKHFEFCQDRPAFPKKYYDSNTVSSIWVGQNTEVELYLNQNMQGLSKSFSQDFDCLSSCIGFMSNMAKSASVFTVVRTQKKFTEEELKKLEDEEKQEEIMRVERSKPEYFSIIYATYGDLDITEKISSIVNRDTYSLTFSAFGDSFGSSLPGVFKTSHVMYWAKSKICVSTVKDHEILNISVELGGNCYTYNYTSKNLKIYAAAYGGKDVTDVLRKLADSSNDYYFIEANTSLFLPDPLQGWKKTLSVYYEVDGKIVKTTILEGDKIDVRTEARKIEEAEITKKKAEEERKLREEEERLKRQAAEKKAEEERKKREAEEKKRLEEERMKFSVIDVQYGPYFVTKILTRDEKLKLLNFQISMDFPQLPSNYLKSSTIFHWANFKVCLRTIKESESITLDSNSDSDAYCHKPPSDDTKIKIYLASFGGADVTSILRNYTRNPNFYSIKASVAEFGRPLPGWANTLFVYYSIGNSFISKIISEEDSIVFSEEIEKAQKEEESKKKEIDMAIAEAKKEEENKKYKFSIAGISYGKGVFTNYATSLFRSGILMLNPNNNIFGDTWVGIVKTLHAFWWQNDKICVKTERENGGIFKIDSTDNTTQGLCYDRPKSNKIEIYAAAYGVLDVTSQMRRKFESSTSNITSFSPSLTEFGYDGLKDGLVYRSFSVYFKINDVFLFAVIVDGESIDFVKIYEKYQSELIITQKTKVKPEVIISTYGTLITKARVQKLIDTSATSRFFIQASDNVFGDPTPTMMKTASVVYLLNGKYCVSSALENDNLVIEDNDSLCYGEPSKSSKVRVYAATYAGKDVTTLVRTMTLRENFSVLTVDDTFICDSGLGVGWLKTLVIYYEFEGQKYVKILTYGSKIDFKYEEKIRKDYEMENGTYFGLTHASYGPLNVTDKVKLMIDSEKYAVDFKPENRLFGDPWVGNSPKYSHVFYTLHNQICVANAVEYGEINIGVNVPVQGNCYDEPKANKSGVKIRAASWGDKDVTEYLRLKSEDPTFGTVFAEDSYFGDPLKTLSIQFEIKGKVFNRIIKEHGVIDLLQEELKQREIDLLTIKAEEERKQKEEDLANAKKEKDKLINSQKENEKKIRMMQILQEEENSHINEEKIALITKQTLEANEKIEKKTKKDKVIFRQREIDRNFLNGIVFKSTKGARIPNNSKIILTHIKTNSKLFTSSNFVNANKGLDVTSSKDKETNITWIIHGNGGKYIANMDEIKLKHTSSNTFLYSRRGVVSPTIGQQEVIAMKNGKDLNTDWKIIIVKNYGEGEELKVGDIIKLKHVASNALLSSHKAIDFFSGNYEVFAIRSPPKDDTNDLFVVTEVKS